MKYKCKSCGHIFEGQSNFCPNCGNKLNYSNLPSKAEKKKVAPKPATKIVYVERKDDGSFLVGFLLGFIISLLGLLIVLCVGKKDTKAGALAGFILQLIGGGLTVLILYFSGLIHW